MRIEVVRGDITAERTDAIVNAANSSLLGGGGVDGAIHRAAGPQLLASCHRLRRIWLPDGLPTGQAVATPGFRLPATWVIHVVGPVYAAAQVATLRPLLASCYVRALAVADEIGARSVAFPAVSAGVYGWPIEDATRVAVDAVRGAATDVELVRLVAYSEAVESGFRAALPPR